MTTAPTVRPGETDVRAAGPPDSRPHAFRSIGTVAGAATVHGVHGAAGRTHWKCFMRPPSARLPHRGRRVGLHPPGGLSGEHRHTRTEEIYLILQGHGEFLFNGVPQRVGPGSLALTAPGNVHGLRNTGDTDLDWWVIETLSPGTDAVLAGADLTPGVPAMGDAVIHDLFKERTVSTDGVFTGPLRQIEAVDLDAGQRTALGRADAELAVFVHSGEGRATAADGTAADLSADTCVTLGADTLTRFEARTALRLLVVTLALPRLSAEAS